MTKLTLHADVGAVQVYPKQSNPTAGLCRQAFLNILNGYTTRLTFFSISLIRFYEISESSIMPKTICDPAPIYHMGRRKDFELLRMYLECQNPMSVVARGYVSFYGPLLRRIDQLINSLSVCRTEKKYSFLMVQCTFSVSRTYRISHSSLREIIVYYTTRTEGSEAGPAITQITLLLSVFCDFCFKMLPNLPLQMSPYRTVTFCPIYHSGSKYFLIEDRKWLSPSCVSS